MRKYSPFMISCREFDSFIIDYLEGDLPPRQRFVFELHVRTCRECRDYLKAYRATIEISVRALYTPDDPVPGDVPPHLVRAVLDARRS